jgi:hypothetical protein
MATHASKSNVISGVNLNFPDEAWLARQAQYLMHNFPDADKANLDIFEENKLRAMHAYYCDIITTFDCTVGPEIFSLYWPTKTCVPDAHIKPEAVFRFFDAMHEVY